MATLREAIDAFWERMAVRDFEKEPIRVVTAVNMETGRWRRQAHEQRHGTYAARRGSQHWLCNELAETGERLGIERVGLVVDQREVVP